MKPLGIAVGLLLVLSAPAVAGGGALDWVQYEDGMEQALRQGKPAVVYFTADW